MRSGAPPVDGGVAIEESRDAANKGNGQPRTHCAHCGKKLTKRQRESGNTHCSHDCLGIVQGWTRTPEHGECLFCGKALTTTQRRNNCQYCCNQHVNLARHHGTWDAWVEATNRYLETRDTWERKAPQMTEAASVRDWHIREIIREAAEYPLRRRRR